MRVLISGANGFVGRWLTRELVAAGHEVVALPPAEIIDLGSESSMPALTAAIWDARPDAVAHLAGVAYAPDAAADPSQALEVTVEGTRRLFGALSDAGSEAAVLVTGSSEVYAIPTATDLPLRESSRLVSLATASPYARSKRAQEEVALEARRDRRVIVTRAFNHTGPGQRPEFVAPALARRVMSVRSGTASSIRVGNVDVRRDIGDVRDTVRAYRLLLVALIAGSDLPPSINVATGRSVSIREVIGALAAAAGVPDAPIEVDPALVRATDAPEIVGSAELLHGLTGWEPEIPLEQTLRDLLDSLDASL